MSPPQRRNSRRSSATATPAGLKTTGLEEEEYDEVETSNDAKEDEEEEQKEEEEKVVDQDDPKNLRQQQQLLQRRKQFVDLHQEMELLGPSVTATGQPRRKPSKQHGKVLTAKRKLVEATDVWRAPLPTTDRANKMRGSKAASQEKVVQGSLIFGKNNKSSSNSGEAEMKVNKEDEMEKEEEESSFSEPEEESGESESESAAAVDKDDDDEEGDETQVEEEDDEDAPREEDDQPQQRKRKPKKNTLPRRKRKLQRLRNFRSTKMARQHGEALGAHARGKPALAIRKLRQVAQEAPSAPQIYSSLGMVYEDMLHQVSRRSTNTNVNQKTTANEQPQQGETLTQENENEDDNNQVTQKVTFQQNMDDEDEENLRQDNLLTEQLNLAKKAYGSYHVAALLCKSDYTLWLRAADSAVQIAALHTDIMKRGASYHDDVIEFHRAEKLRWLQEAKNDYQTADHLNPPGLDIPAKLADVMMQLGLLPEALTVITDLKNNNAAFGGSYRSWLLYADLMLRIGHECTQWNRGIQTNSHYMFRRWLRKLSNKFDWQERRLQGLVMALQAAAGSHNCAKLVHWLQNRRGVLDEKLDTASTDGATVATAAGGDTNNQNGKSTNGTSSLTQEQGQHTQYSAQEFESEKQVLLSRNKSELAAFDKTSSEMGLEPNSVECNVRDEARSKLVRKHKDALVTLVAEYHQQQQQNADEKGSSESISPENNKQETTTTSQEQELALSASCSTVCSIASELMRHMLGLDLYSGGELVGEAVSLYFKERAALRDKRKRAGNDFVAAQQRPTNLFAMQHASYDAGDQNSSDGELSDIPLSDDDDLDKGDEATVIEPMRRGTLPPELSTLYGLSLAGGGGKAFLATKCLKTILDLSQEPLSWLTEPAVDTNVSTDSVWQLFYEAMSEPLGRTAAFALVADVLRRSGQESSLCERVAPLFSQHVDDLTSAGMVDLVGSREQRRDLVLRQRQNQVVKIIVAEMRFRVHKIETMSRREEIDDSTAGRDFAFDAIDSLTKLISLVWKVESNGSISSTSVEAVETLSRTFGLLASYSQRWLSDGHTQLIQLAVEKMLKPISILCGTPTLTATGNIKRSLADLSSIPLPTSWLSPDLAAISLRAFNACVACNVSRFSGWEPEEFSVRLLRGSCHSYFGITMDNGSVAGLLSPEIENDLLEQWDMLQRHLPQPLPFDFQTKISELKASKWYRETKEIHEKTKSAHRICFYGEESALSVLLGFSRVCLDMSNTTNENKPIFIALSILLPLSQFCLNCPLWGATVGQAKASSALFGVEDWRVSRKKDAASDRLPPSMRPDYVRPSKRSSSSAPGSSNYRALHDWFRFENESSPLSNLIAMPLGTLLRAWRTCPQSADDAAGATDSATGPERMNKLDASVKKLRMCYTEQAVEKASLQVAANLLLLVGDPECHNPFLCLQQSALFASQGPKRGTSDQPFQLRLPSPEMCTPLEALLIVGRADCLRAVCFCQEAAFLCGYVATICRLRREKVGTEEWNARWRAVSVLAYDLSVMIRTTAAATMLEQEKREDTTETWEAEVIDELEEARFDGLTWKAEEIPNGEIPEAFTRNLESIAENSNVHDTSVLHGELNDTDRLKAVPWLEELGGEQQLQPLSDERDPKLFAV